MFTGVETMYQDILVPTDGSAPSTAALEQALALAKQLGSNLTILHAYDDPFLLWATTETIALREGLYEDYERLGKEILNRAEAMAKEAEVPARTSLVKNRHPVDAILDVSSDHDLIVMGSHGRRGLDRVMMGSVTERVLRSSKQPMLIIPAWPSKPPARH